MRFYVRKSADLPPSALLPCAVIVPDSWDDFGYVTTFSVTAYFDSETVLLESTVKILMRARFPSAPEPDQLTTDLETEFERLPENACSLGTTSDYYVQLREAGDDFYREYLEAMRDVVFDRRIAEEFENLPGFRKSLLRSSEAEKAYFGAGRLLRRKSYRSIFHFRFSSQLPNAESPHRVNFDFRRHPTDLHRSTVLIGRNGTGKTQFLATFARAMSGINPEDGRFWPRRPSFSRVIAISYSAFDDFSRPQESEKRFSYVYCGIRSNEPQYVAGKPADRLLTQPELRNRLEQSLAWVFQQNRLRIWRKMLTTLLEREVRRGPKAFEAKAAMQLYDSLSSGHKMIMAVFTEVLANVRENSIILFDEPELHLHPDVFTGVIRALDQLLRSFKSYAIVATHSPLLLQETMARQVRIFRRIENEPIVASLNKECFGENLTAITREVFEFSSEKADYREELTRLRKNHPPKKIESMFPLGLPLGALTFLRAPKGKE